MVQYIDKKLKKIKSPKYKVGDTIFNSKNNAESFVILSKDEYFYYGNNCSLLIPIADNEWKPLNSDLNHRKGCDMAQENKELLLKDLLGRVLYGVKVDYNTNIFTLGYNLYLDNSDVAFENYPMLYFLEKIESVKPYLRPLSSMTEEEKGELKEYLDAEEVDCNGFGYIEGGTLEDYVSSIPYSLCSYAVDWLNKHHFDYRGLIEKGLALEAPEGMYNI